MAVPASTCRRVGIAFLAISGILHQPEASGQAASNRALLYRPSNALNRATPDWLTIGSSYRFRMEGRTGIGYQSGADDAYGLGRMNVNVGIKPKPWLNLYFQGQDSRAPGKENPAGFFRDSFDIRQAYVELGNQETYKTSLRVGRQELKYGAQRLIGPLDWGNTARQFDAVKVTFGGTDTNVDLFAASVVRIDPDGLNRRRDGQNLHGAYAALNKLMPNTTFETYLLWKTTPLVIGESGSPGDADIYTAGFRLVKPLPKGFDAETEVAGQFGSFAGDDVSAWGAYGILGYTAGSFPWKPRFSVEYQYGSGDDDPTDGKRGTFDQLFPTGHLYQGLADQVGWRNVSDVRAGVALELHSRLRLNFDYFSFWLANGNDHFYGVGGAVAVRRPMQGAGNKHIGEEFDAILVYKPAPHVTFGGGVGRFFPGAFLKQSTPGAAHTFPYVFVNYVL